MTHIVRARWVLPIDRPPIDGGWIEIHDRRIARVGHGVPPASADDLGNCAIIPGLVNAHTHLELGWLAGRIPASTSIVEWIRALIRERGAGPQDGERGVVKAIERGIQEARDTGTVLVGDVSNTLATPSVLQAIGMPATVFYELLGFNLPDPSGLVGRAWERVDELHTSHFERQTFEPRNRRTLESQNRSIEYSVVAHAPYSVSPALFQAIAAAQRQAPLSIHLAESAEEMELLATGGGAFRALLEELGAWTDRWQAPRCGPVEYLKGLGYLHSGCLVVHGVHLSPSALEELRDQDVVLVTCPRSNEWVGGGMPPVSHFYASGARVAVGTDSLASVGSLSLFDELAALRRIAPEVSAASLLESATRIGAEALGRGGELGTITPGKRAALVSVRVPDAVHDVEECLVGGIEREAISLVGQWQ